MAILSSVAGILLGESLYRLHQRESCPTLAKDGVNSLVKTFKETPLTKIVFGVFVSVIFSRLSLLIAARGLKGRITYISTLCHRLGAAIGTYRISIPLLLGTNIYLGRRHFLVALIKQLEALYNATEELRAFFASAAAHPDETIAKAQQELEEGVQGICESIQYILFANDPKIVRTIDREIGDFEKHLRSLKEKMPIFEKKLEKAQDHLTKTRQDLMLQLSLMEQQSSELEELFKKFEKKSSELGLESFRELLGHQDFIDKQHQFNAQIETMQDLANKIDLIMSGLRLVKQADSEEIKAINRWYIYIHHTSLPILEDAFLITCDMPHLCLKMFNEIAFNTPQRSDDLWSYLRRRVKLSETLPKGVETFAQALILFKQVRKTVLDCLTSLEITTPLAKKNWLLERKVLEEGRRHFNEADLMFCEKLFPKHRIGKIAGSFRTQGERLKKISKEVEEIRETIDRFKKA